MEKTSGPNRRTFLKTVAAGSAAVSQSSAQPRATASLPRKFTGRNLQMIAFPLGGIAAGSISLGGRGQLRDWEIFNRPDKGRTPSYAFPSLWVQVDGSKPVARVLESRLQPPYQAAEGLGPGNVPGLERIAGATFTGEFPLAQLEFQDTQLPVRVRLEAFSPISPLDAEDSGLPVAVLRYSVTNPNARKAAVSIAWAIDNPAGADPARPSQVSRTGANEFRRSELLEGFFMNAPETPPDSPLHGSFALVALDADDAKTTWLRGWPRAKWWASPLLFWDDFSSDGELGPEAESRDAIASLCLKRELPAGATAHYTFLLAWHFPNRTPAGCGWSAPKGEENTVIGNHYCQRFPDAWAAAEYAAEHLPDLEARMRSFIAVMRESTVPAAVKDAATANLSTLVTNTCFRTADGRFRGFEGNFDQRGCCHGNCTHVWNYESTTDYLFPTLARSMRESAFDLAERLDGVLPIRLQLPEGKQTGGTTAADGTMGQIMKAYLDWQTSGDHAWLRTMWPKLKRAMEFAWIEGGWDGNKDGVMEGVQHNTFDVEFYGPNPMCGVYYLGGLRACEEMARAMGEETAAAEYRRLFESGRAWIDANLFNGEFYIQKVTGIPRDRIAAALRSTGGAEDPEHPDFQLGDGCLVDQLVGQYVAGYCGLGPLVDPAHIRKTLASIYKNNYEPSLYGHESVQRIYALNDEAGVVICTYAPGKRPKIPFPYFAEVWTGFEYAIASLMLEHGMLEEGTRCIASARRRFDGERRNPWDETECGHHYARAMSAWSALVALSGFRYSGPAKRIVIAPPSGDPLVSFYSTAASWGRFTHARSAASTRFTIAPKYGTLALAEVELGRAGARSATVAVNKTKIPYQLRQSGDRVVIVISEPLSLTARDELSITV